MVSNVTADDAEETTLAHPAYVDADGDGVCDNYATRAGSGYGRGNGVPGSNYVDEDGDGVCDNAGSGYGRGTGIPGANFVDADGDGVCDNCAARLGQGNMKGNGKKMRHARRTATTQ